MAQRIPPQVNKTIKEYIKVLKKEVPVERVILYGSHARGNTKKNSDIDIAIISKKFGKNPHEDGKFLMRKLWEVTQPNLEPTGYSPKDFESKNPSPLLAEIKKHGKEVRI